MFLHWGFPCFMKKFLIIQTSFIGDVVLATSLVEKLKSHYPYSSIDILLRKGNEAILKNNPHVRRVIVWDKKEYKYWNYFDVLKRIRKENYDHLINLHRFFSSGLLTVFSNAKETIGFDKNPCSFFFTKKIKHQIGLNKNPIHEVGRNLLLIRHLTDNQLFRPKIYPTKKDYNKIKVRTPFITISPGSVWFTKQWPIKKWINFIDILNESFNIYLLGGENEFGLCNEIKLRAHNSKVHILAGQLTFLESAALMSLATMNYVNDSAPLHLASAVNAPVTAIFCSTVPAFGFTPLSDNSKVIETKEDLKCRPCGLHGIEVCPKGHFKCSNIQVERLLDRLR